jgi:hypothetical protein
MRRLSVVAPLLLLLGGCGDDSPGPADMAVDDGPDLSMSGVMPHITQRFAVIGDYGVNTMDEGAVAGLVKRWAPDFIVTVGDNNYPNGEALTIDGNIGQHFGEYIGSYTGKYGKGSPVNRFWPALGNHDWYSADGDQPYLDYFPALPGNRRYYDVALGDIHLFVVDSDPHEPDGITANSVQAQWLAARMAASTECFNLVVFHHPAYSSGDPIFTEPKMRWPFKEWGADVVLTGHQHQYERLIVGGLPYVVDGLGGALNRFGFASVEPGSMVRYSEDFGALFVEVARGKLFFTFRDTHGKVIDAFEVARDCASAREPFDAGF